MSPIQDVGNHNIPLNNLKHITYRKIDFIQKPAYSFVDILYISSTQHSIKCRNFNYLQNGTLIASEYVAQIWRFL